MAFSKRLDNWGLEKRSSCLTRLTIKGSAFLMVLSPSFMRFMNHGSHSDRLPNTICREATITVGRSMRLVIPPVGTGSAGINIKSKNRMAKLFSPKTSCKSPTVLDPLLFSQVSKSTLNGLFCILTVYQTCLAYLLGVAYT